MFTDEIIIEPGRAERNYWRDLWRFRELLYCLAERDLLVRYKQTAIGVLWALIRPALTMAIFVGFRMMTKIQSTTIPDPILVYAALLPWQFFSNALTEAAEASSRTRISSPRCTFRVCSFPPARWSPHWSTWA